MAENNFRKILIIQTAFIGDVILATGIVEKLHHFFPESEIDFLLKKENKTVLSGHPFIKDVLTFDKTKKFKEVIRIIKKMRSRKYDLVINLHRFFSSGLLTIFSGARTKVGFDKNPLSFLFTQTAAHSIDAKGVYTHEMERNNGLISTFTDTTPFKPKLHLQDLDFKVIKIYQKIPYVCIAPSSVWYTKQLPEEKWVEFIKKIPEEFAVLILGAISDISLSERIKNNSRRNNVKNLAGSLSFTQSAALMQGAVLNIVNDSAPLHLASAVNAPVCAVFCSTVPAFGFGPVSDFSRIVEIEYALECRPCNLHGYQQCPLGHFKCAKDIKAEQMLQVFKEVTQVNRS